MVKGETKSGFKFVADDEAMDDIEFIELLAQVDETPTVLPKIAKTVLGDEQYETLKDHLRNKKGRVPVEAFTTALEEIFEAAGEEVKNSEPSPE